MRICRRVFHFATFSLILGLLAGGCAQPGDVVTPVAETQLLFTSSPNQPQGVDRMPTAPPGMIYQMWVSSSQVFDTTVPTANLRSISRFNFVNSDTGNFLVDSIGRRMTSFTLPGDLYSYASIFVSVERLSDPDPSRPSNILLIDNIRRSDDQVLKMVFPFSEDLWLSILRFNMEGITDNNSASNDGAGIWFATYRRVVHNIPDTTNIIPPTGFTNFDTLQKDTMVPILGPNPGDTVNLAILKAPYAYYYNNIRPETTYLDLGPDSLLVGSGPFRHIYTRWDSLKRSDNTYPYVKNKINFQYTTIDRNVSIDLFSQDAFGLPNYSRLGWKWEGWVVSPTITQAALGAMTRPAWKDSTANFDWLPAARSGGLLSTGQFTRVDTVDESDKFLLLSIRHIDTTRNGLGQITDIDTTYKRPDFPGEDFLNVDSLTLYLGVNLVNLAPNATGNTGTVFITLEPMNRLTDSTNFPLIAFTANIPANRGLITADSSVSVPMFNRTATSGGPFALGFPEIRMTFRRL